MKCQHEHCGGTVLLYRGNCNEPDIYKCSSCGREPEMTTKRESGVGGVGPERPKEKMCNKRVSPKCKGSLPMTNEYFSFVQHFQDKMFVGLKTPKALNRSNPDGFDRICKECWKTIRADKKKKKGEKRIQPDRPGRRRLMDKTPKGGPGYTDPIELPV